MAVDPRRLPQLSSATVGIDPTRVRDVSALLNLPAALPASATAPIAFRPTLADETAPKWEPSMLMRIGGILNGQSRDDLYRERDAELAQDALLPQLQALKAAQLKAAGGLGGRELLAYMTNPGKYGENLSSRYGAANLGGGDSRVFGEPEDGGSVFTAPKLQIEDGAGIKLTPDAMTVLGRLPRKPEFQTVGKDQSLIQLPTGDADPPAGLPKSPQATADAVWRAAIMQESGGRAGVIGPDTAYGNAQGLTQMLPATAKSMAEKLGVAWVPELMTAATPEAAAYQEKLGRAYFDEGMERYGGDVAKAVAFYHGGPNEALWGPKTRAHVSAVLGKAGMSRDTLAGGAGADEVALPGGARVIATGPKSASPRPITAEERKTWGIPEGVPALIKADGTPDVISLPGGNSSPRKTEADFRKAFDALGEVKEYRAISNAYRTIQRLSNEDTPAGDISMLFSYMKMLDPTSVVREGEFATAQNATGIPGQVQNAYNRAINGTRLAPKQREDFRNQARNIYLTRADRFDEIANDYRGYATAYDVDPDNVVKLRDDAEAQAPGPSRPAGWSKTLPPPMLETAKQFKGSKSAGGSLDNPFLPVTEAQYAKLPSGAHYVFTDGSIRVKP